MAVLGAAAFPDRRDGAGAAVRRPSRLYKTGSVFLFFLTYVSYRALLLVLEKDKNAYMVTCLLRNMYMIVASIQL